MRVKTSELEGKALDAAVMKALGFPLWDSADAKYSTSWFLGGPLLERFLVDVIYDGRGTWSAGLNGPRGLYVEPCTLSSGPTPLIAAMRAIVAAELGYEVDVPEGLV